MTRLLVVAAALVVVLAAAGVGDADEVNVTLKGHFGGTTYAVVASGSYTYVGQGQDFAVLDISDPVASAEVGRGSNGLVILHVAPSDTPQKGDLNSDDILTPTDAAIALQIAVGSRPFDDAADVSGDGSVTSLDALMILQAASGTINI
ncbi:MAG TPA: hypothetical protein ENF23_02725 [Methanosarcinales archaeon]|nr:hypothetical protein [Methanosarcinales archaeon]